VPPGTPPLSETAWSTGRRSEYPIRLANQETPTEEQAERDSQHLGAVSPDVCYECHAELRRFEDVVHPHQLGVPFEFHCTACHDPAPRGAPRDVEDHPRQFDCTTCHDPHGNVTRESRKELCLTCHQGPHMDQWHSSPHDRAGVACTDCHDPHPEVGVPMAVNQPEACYRCHAETQNLELIAHPHQLLGPGGFNCDTCHDPHGQITSVTREELCLRCHDGAPTMAWHSSRHGHEGVACTDCHNPHPRPEVLRVAGIGRTSVQRPQRLPMSVEEPNVCYRCHEEIYGRVNMPSRHPILDGKMVCSRCHDSHGEYQDGLKADSVNELCYECHAEKEGPFVYEHPPVTEDCAICHEPHGTVASKLLRQPPVFLCLRCHSGHSAHDQFLNGQPPGGLDCDECHAAHNANGQALPPAAPPGTNTLGDMGVPNALNRRALFTDCTQCHTQVHGSDLPNTLDGHHHFAR
jgi:DmsE family decaheme c-type cytochrome